MLRLMEDVRVVKPMRKWLIAGIHAAGFYEHCFGRDTADIQTSATKSTSLLNTGSLVKVSLGYK